MFDEKKLWRTMVIFLSCCVILLCLIAYNGYEKFKPCRKTIACIKGIPQNTNPQIRKRATELCEEWYYNE
jgi:hypothetical protein